MAKKKKNFRNEIEDVIDLDTHQLKIKIVITHAEIGEESRRTRSVNGNIKIDNQVETRLVSDTEDKTKMDCITIRVGMIDPYGVVRNQLNYNALCAGEKK